MNLTAGIIVIIRSTKMIQLRSLYKREPLHLSSADLLKMDPFISVSRAEIHALDCQGRDWRKKTPLLGLDWEIVSRMVTLICEAL